MHLYPFLAVLFTLTAALSDPTVTIAKRTNNCAGVTLYRQQHLKGNTLGWDFTSVIASDACVDLNTGVFGGFADKARSLRVEYGRVCWFYTAYGCPDSIEGTYYKLGNRKSAVKAQTLGRYWDAKIRSVWCKTLGGDADEEVDERNGRTTDGRECLE